MLKDFLRDDPNSCSSDFLSFPRLSGTTVRNLLEIDLNCEDDAFGERRLRRSRSVSAASTTISAFHKAVMIAVKHFPFYSRESSTKQGILPRSLSQTLRRSFSKKKAREIGNGEKTKNKLNFSWKANGRIRIRSRSSSSWAKSDSTEDFLRCSSGSLELSTENERNVGNKELPDVGVDSVETATSYGETEQQRGKSKVELENHYEEKEQLSPVSVLDFPYEDEEIDTPSSFQESLANMERTKQQLLKKIQRFECLAQLDPVNLEKRISQSELEEEEDSDKGSEEEDDDDDGDDRCRYLLKCLKTGSNKTQKREVDKLLLDFFQEGLSKADGIEEELLRMASDWMKGCIAMGWAGEYNRELLIKEMERNENRRKFKEEEDELAMEMEIGLLGSLVEEMLLDLLH